MNYCIEMKCMVFKYYWINIDEMEKSVIGLMIRLDERKLLSTNCEHLITELEMVE